MRKILYVVICFSLFSCQKQGNINNYEVKLLSLCYEYDSTSTNLLGHSRSVNLYYTLIFKNNTQYPVKIDFMNCILENNKNIKFIAKNVEKSILCKNDSIYVMYKSNSKFEYSHTDSIVKQGNVISEKNLLDFIHKNKKNRVLKDVRFNCYLKSRSNLIKM